MCNFDWTCAQRPALARLADSYVGMQLSNLCRMQVAARLTAVLVMKTLGSSEEDTRMLPLCPLPGQIFLYPGWSMTFQTSVIYQFVGRLLTATWHQVMSTCREQTEGYFGLTLKREVSFDPQRGHCVCERLLSLRLKQCTFIDDQAVSRAMIILSLSILGEFWWL